METKKPFSGQLNSQSTRPSLRRFSFRFSRYLPRSRRSISNSCPPSMPSCSRISAGKTIWPSVEILVVMDGKIASYHPNRQPFHLPSADKGNVRNKRNIRSKTLSLIGHSQSWLHPNKKEKAAHQARPFRVIREFQSPATPAVSCPMFSCFGLISYSFVLSSCCWSILRRKIISSCALAGPSCATRTREA